MTTSRSALQHHRFAEVISASKKAFPDKKLDKYFSIEKDEVTGEPTLIFGVGRNAHNKIYLTYDPSTNLFTPKGYSATNPMLPGTDINSYMSMRISLLLDEAQGKKRVRVALAAAAAAGAVALAGYVKDSKGAELNHTPDQDQPVAAQKHLEL